MRHKEIWALMPKKGASLLPASLKEDVGEAPESLNAEAGFGWPVHRAWVKGFGKVLLALWFAT